MSDTNSADELARLRAELEVLERYAEGPRKVYTTKDAVFCVREDIARLEAEADPWRRAKSAVEYFRGFAGHKQAEHDVVAYVDHLEAENAAKAKRIDDLESRPVPPLDRKRVIATACKVIRESAPLSKEKLMHAGCLMMEFKAGNAGIYPLEGEDATP